ncbi:MAG: hypothetical protein O7H41_08270 [Planctomycetota bacterium]|nr:hypothetical protein [Planctomycetota bacterium]
MTKEAGKQCKRSHFGGIFKKLFVLVAIVALFYGALYRINTRTWPWQDWNDFLRFSKTSTRSAYEKGKKFTTETVLPKTKQLLAKAQGLLDRWDTETPAPVDEQAEPQPSDVDTGEEALEIPGPSEKASDMVEDRGEEETDQPIVIEEERAPVRSPARKMSPEISDDWQSARDNFREGVMHYQRSSAEMDEHQVELKAAKEAFHKSIVLFEKAQAADPDNHLIDRDIQEVQVFLIDCQRRLKVPVY